MARPRLQFTLFPGTVHQETFVKQTSTAKHKTAERWISSRDPERSFSKRAGYELYGRPLGEWRRRSAGADPRYRTHYWQAGRETGPPLGHVTLRGLVAQLVLRGWDSGNDPVQLAVYSNRESDGKTIFRWNAFVHTGKSLISMAEAILATGVRGPEAMNRFAVAIAGEPQPSEVRAVAYRSAHE
jgi:hypothetical protein